MRRLTQALSLLICGLPIALTVPEWLVACWVGICWGTLWLTGLSATWTNQRLAWSLYCGLVSLSAHASLSSTTGLGSHAIWLIIALLLSTGWLTGIACVPWRETLRLPGRDPGGKPHPHLDFDFRLGIFCALPAW